MYNSSPYYLLFGRDPSATLEQVHLDAATEGHEEDKEVHQFVRSQLDNYRKIFETARKNLRQSVIKHQRLYRKNVQPFEVGDLVLVYMPKLPPHTSKKLHRHWSGPYQISAVINSVTYRVAARRPGGRRYNPALTIDRLRKYYPREGLKDLDKVVAALRGLLLAGEDARGVYQRDLGEQLVLLLGALEPVEERVAELGQRPEGKLGVAHQGVAGNGGGDVLFILIKPHNHVKSF